MAVRFARGPHQAGPEQRGKKRKEKEKKTLNKTAAIETKQQERAGNRGQARAGLPLKKFADLLLDARQLEGKRQRRREVEAAQRTSGEESKHVSVRA